MPLVRVAVAVEVEMPLAGILAGAKFKCRPAVAGRAVWVSTALALTVGRIEMSVAVMVARPGVVEAVIATV
jgi:hypothetical protein